MFRLLSKKAVSKQTVDRWLHYVYIYLLSESTRSRAFDLVGQAYASISAEDLSAFVGLPVADAVSGTAAF